MKKYFLSDGENKTGPFSLEEIKQKNISSNIQVWHEGLDDWVTAKEIPVLKDFITKDQTPPPIKRIENSQPPPVKRNQDLKESNSKTKKKRSLMGMLALISIPILIIGVIGLFIVENINNSYYESASTLTYTEKIMTVEEEERANPVKFLEADGTYRENFGGDKFKISGKIKNKATVATYKDATVRVTYYTKSKTKLGSEDYTIYEVFPPNSTKEFKLKVQNYKDVDSLGWEVINAVNY